MNEAVRKPDPRFSEFVDLNVLQAHMVKTGFGQFITLGLCQMHCIG